ncbi:MAG: hypothetical protein HYZ25_05375 [Chloroflexi bacterium]|nr:hypothetical protein [Chloroflexota bacterium]
MYTLKIGNKTISIQDGETIRVEGFYQNPEITLIVEPYDLFSCDDVRFQYPREFIYEADLEQDHVKSWTLSGNDCKIMYFAFDVPIQVNDFLDSMLERYGRQNCMVTDAVPLTLGQRIFTGTAIHTTLAGVKISVDIYQIPSSASGTSMKLLVVQDCIDSFGSRSTEGTHAIQLLEQSFHLDT